MRPTVLIVIVNYRTTGLVIDCLGSIDREIRAGTVARVVVVDNLSGDDSVGRLQAAVDDHGWRSWATVLASNRNGGFAAGNNLALRPELARPPEDRARYTLILNPDTLLRPGAVDALSDFLDRHPEAGIAGSRLEDLDGRAQGSARRLPSPIGEFLSAARIGPVTRLLSRYNIPIPDSDHFLRCGWVSGAAMMVRTELLDTVGLFDEGFFLYYEETDFCRRAADQGWQIWYVPQSRVVHFEGSSTGIRKRNQRRPRYWYESRRRYYVKALGPWGWMRADCGWALGRLLWTVQKLSGLVACRDDDPQRFASDLIGGDWQAVASGAWRRILESPTLPERALRTPAPASTGPEPGAGTL